MNGISRFVCFAALAACLFVTTTASAAGPAKVPNCGTDFDGDGYCVPDMSRMNGAVPPVPGFVLGAQDCNDADRGVNPGEKEIPGDGIDNDCSAGVVGAGGATGDLAVPAYIGHFCKPITATCIRRVEAEIAVCKAATGKCTVNYTGGSFVTTSDHYFLDRDCNLLREVITQGEYNTFVAAMRQSLQNPTWTPRPDGLCTEVQSKACSSCRGTSRARPKGQTKTTTSATKDPATDEWRTGVDGSITELKTQSESTLTVLRRSVEDYTVLAAALQAETEARTAEDTAIRADLQTATETARSAGDIAVNAVREARSANKAANRAANATQFNGGLTVSVGVISQAAVPLVDATGQKTGDFARGPTSNSVLASAHAGGETLENIFRVTLKAGVPWDEGKGGNTETGFIWGAGAEWCHKFAGGHCLGALVGYTDHNSGGTLNGSNVFSRGASAGLLYEYTRGNGSYRWKALRATVEGGREAFGTQGDDFDPKSEDAWFAGATVGTGFEFGSANRDGTSDEDADDED